MIRKARKEDAQALSEINYLVIHDFFQQIAENDEEEQKQMEVIETYILSEEDALSYQNIYIAERDGEIAGAMWLYDYNEQLEKYENLEDDVEEETPPLLSFLIEPEEEGKPGDLYLDTIAVAEKWQGHGVASELLNYAKEIAKTTDNDNLSLIVDENNPHAEKVYLKHGFETKEAKPMYGSVYRYMRHKQ